MLLEILPDSLYGSSNIKVVFKNRSSSIIYKSLSKSLLNKKMVLATSAILVVVNGEQTISKYDSGDLVVNENEMVLLPKKIYIVSQIL
ncbi:hypothetical protein MNBD_GAMMA12-2722 [hydrothermal vent metagenome]|uniref:Mannose-6-phosphate isomerase n=1 Tax=hydrothermal vent metagenome TaxID=652676 RepID=A0A3B0YIC4_9ZZZZ